MFLCINYVLFKLIVLNFIIYCFVLAFFFLLPAAHRPLPFLFSSLKLQPVMLPGSDRPPQTPLLWQRLLAPLLAPQQQVVDFELGAKPTRSVLLLFLL